MRSAKDGLPFRRSSELLESHRWISRSTAQLCAPAFSSGVGRHRRTVMAWIRSEVPRDARSEPTAGEAAAAEVKACFDGRAALSWLRHRPGNVLPDPRAKQGTPVARSAAEGQDWPRLAGALVAGGVVVRVLLLLGLAATAAWSASLLRSLESVFTALLAWFVFKEIRGAANWTTGAEEPSAVW